MDISSGLCVCILSCHIWRSGVKVDRKDEKKKEKKKKEVKKKTTNSQWSVYT